MLPWTLEPIQCIPNCYRGLWNPYSAHRNVTVDSGTHTVDTEMLLGGAWGPSSAYLIVTEDSGSHTVHTEMLLGGSCGPSSTYLIVTVDFGTHTVHTEMLPWILGPTQCIPKCYWGELGPIQCIPNCYRELWCPYNAYLLVTGRCGTHPVHTKLTPGAFL